MKKIFKAFFLCFLCISFSNNVNAQSAKQVDTEILNESIKNYANSLDRCSKNQSSKGISTEVDLPDVSGAIKDKSGKPTGKVVKIHLDASGKQIMTLSKSYVSQLSTEAKARLKNNSSYLIED